MKEKIIFAVVFLPVILFIGFITSYQDFKQSRIRNKWVILGVVYPVLIYFISWILYYLAQKGTVSPVIGGISSYLIWNFDKWCVNLAVSAAVAYILWCYELWGAGDAKLFICYCALIPMGQYSRGYFNYYFASFLLLLTIFMPALLFLFFKSALYYIKQFNPGMIMKAAKLIKEKLINTDKKEIGKILAGFFVFFLSFKILSRELQQIIDKFLPNQNILIVLSMFLFKHLSKFFKKNSRQMIVVLIMLMIYFGYKMIYSPGEFILEIVSTFSRAVSVMALFPVFRKITKFYIEKKFKTAVPFAIWMFLGILIAWFI